MLRHHFRAGGVITTVDAVNGLAQIECHAESVRQAAIADVIALTKTDLAEEAAAARLVARLRTLNPSAPLLRVAEAPLDTDALLNAGGSGWFKAIGEAESAAAAHSDVSAFSIIVDEPIDWTAFGIWLTMLLNRHGARILRVKGILALRGEELPVAVHGVQHLVHAPTHLTHWPSAERGSRLVFIVEGMEHDLIRRSFALFNRLSLSVAA